FPEVIKLCGDESTAESDPGPCYLGADVGNLIHCVIGKKHPDKAGQIVYVGAFPEWSHLDCLMARFGVCRAVIDALPETRMARDFALRHKGKVYLCYYQEHQKGSYAWNERDFTVSANRTEALDASHNELSKGEVILPQECETIHEFAGHCSNVARVLQTDPDTGASKYRYLKTGSDHYRHAQSYESMARGYGAKSAFNNCDLS
ncbi:phage tail protein, partial [Gemmatimonadota bacterium]